MEVHEQLFLQNNPLTYYYAFLDPFQFAHQSKQSCENVILLILDKLLSQIKLTSDGYQVCVMFFILKYF